MNVRKFWRLSCMTIASLFWASCGSDSNPQIPEPLSPLPDSSSDANGISSSAEPASSSASVESSSSDAAQPSSSSEVPPPSSSSLAAPETISSSSSANSAEFVLARDPSVTCKKDTYKVSACTSSSKSVRLTCEDYQRYLGKDTTVSEKLLLEWESQLQSCGAIFENVALYGIVYDPCGNAFIDKPYFKCSNDSTYEDFKLDENRVYTSIDEYNKAHGISSSSVARSSSSAPKDLVKNCPQEEFVLFADILAEVQLELYAKLVKNIEENTALSDSAKSYLESLLDRDKKTLKGNFSPYSPGYNLNVKSTVLRESKQWFNGYIAKTKNCTDETPVKTELYQQKYAAIYSECLDLIEKNLKTVE